MNPKLPLVLVPLVALALAGCVAPPAPEPIDPQATLSALLPHVDLGEDHDHKDRAQHAVAWNVEALGWSPIAPDASKLGRYNHVNVHGTRAFVTAYELEAGGAPGLAILNLSSDPPVVAATLATPDLTPIDVHVSEDGRYVVIAGHRDNRFALPGEAQTCTGTPMVDVCTPFVAGGVMVIDVQDETSPRVVATWTSQPSGAHTAKIVQIDGAYHVFVASYGFSYASRVASHVEVLMLQQTPLGQNLLPVAQFFPSEPSGNDGEARRFVHDMYVAPHPDGRLLMYVSYWDGGVVIADVSDPHAPTEVALWREFDVAQYGNIHFARPVGEIGGRYVVMAAPEFGSAQHAGEMYVLDATDPASPKLLSKWTLPGDPVTDENYRFSPHNFDPRGSLVAYAHYHGGVWVLDLADPEAPAVKGYVFPTVPAEVVGFEPREDAPRVWAAVWADDGTLYSSDVGAGLFHHRLLSDEPGTPPYLGQTAPDA